MTAIEQAEAVLLGWHDQRTCEEIKGKLHDWDGHIVELSRAVAADAYCVECGISAIDAKADIDRRDALAALVEEAKALGELQDACIKRYCGMTGPDEWREAVRKSPEGQRLIAIAATQSEHGDGDV
jgi:hypothetical protein